MSLDEDPELAALVRVISGLPAIDRRSLCRMHPTFWGDLGRELTSAAMFGDPGRLKVQIHHRNDGIVEQADFTAERERKFRVVKRT